MADNLQITAGSGTTIATDEAGGAQYQKVKLTDGTADATTAIAAGSGLAANALRVELPTNGTGVIDNITSSIKVHILSTAGTMAVNIGKTDGTITVRLDPSYELGSIKGVNSSMAVHMLSTNGTMAVNVGKTDGTVTVRFDPGYELGSIKGINSSAAIHIGSTGGTMAVNIGKTDGTITIRTDPGYELGSIKGINSSVSIHLNSTAGTVAVKLDPGYNVVNGSETIVLPRTVSGTANGVSTSGNTVVSGVASRVIKVFAFALTTTAQVGIAPRFTNGSGASPTEFWRYALQAPSQGIAGANLAVTPPAYLFATVAGSTLSLVLDSASLVHYSVGYYLESA